MLTTVWNKINKNINYYFINTKIVKNMYLCSKFIEKSFSLIISLVQFDFSAIQGDKKVWNTANIS